MKLIVVIIVMLSFLAMTNMNAAGNNLSVTATVVSKSNCRFKTAASTLAFGTLDPGNPSDKTVTTSATFRCGGSASTAIFAITHDSGLHETGADAPRMRHATVATEYLPYTIGLSPSSGSVPKNTDHTLTISGTVKGVDFRGAYAGNFADTVVISIEP